MVGRAAPARSQAGFTYLTVMFVIAILLGGLAIVGETWETSARREKEAELLFIGNQYRRAIGLYYASTPGVVKRYPRTLDDLIKDPRQPNTQRHIRKLYPDPMTGKEWLVIKGADGGVQGVQSASEEAPLKLAGFRVRDASLEGAQKYSDWKFIHTPPAQPAAAPGAANPGAQKPGADGAANPAAPNPAPKSEAPGAMGFGTIMNR
jgi:type II secretory pathway pseudopilin PulG